MSKQLAMSITASVLAMSAYVLLGNDAYSAWASTGDAAPAQYQLELKAAGGTQSPFAPALASLRPVSR